MGQLVNIINKVSQTQVNLEIRQDIVSETQTSMTLNSTPFKMSQCDDSQQNRREERFESFNAYAEDFNMEPINKSGSLDLGVKEEKSELDIQAVPFEDLAQIKRKSNYMLRNSFTQRSEPSPNSDHHSEKKPEEHTNWNQAPVEKNPSRGCSPKVSNPMVWHKKEGSITNTNSVMKNASSGGSFKTCEENKEDDVDEDSNFLLEIREETKSGDNSYSKNSSYNKSLG